MALRLVTDHEDLIPALSSVVPSAPVVLTSAEITGLIGLFQTMLDRTERNILDRLEFNSRGAADRWRKHDDELTANTARVVARFEKVEASIDVTSKALQAHLDREHEDDIRMDARVRPVQIGVAWAAGHWKDIAILLVGIIGLFAVAADIASRYLGGGS